ncbi:MAG: hypothetical protein K0S68_1129 [Candidatus Saccharibacteria bacterium]|nr:hypothetical protein [Candidatus Saccharibacteria bacterium]
MRRLQSRRPGAHNYRDFTTSANCTDVRCRLVCPINDPARKIVSGCLVCYHAVAMSLMPPTPVRLVPGLLRARGLKIGLKRLQSALDIGTIPGTYEKRRWVLTAENVDAAERYFRETAAPGARKGGAAGLDQARRRSQQGHAG